MKTRAEIKREARESLKSQRGLAVGALLLTALLAGGLSAIPLVGWLLNIFIGTIITVGCAGIFVLIYRKQQAGIGGLFSPFNRYGRVLGGMLWMSLWLALWSLIFIIPFVVYFTTVTVTSYIGYGYGMDATAMLVAMPFFYLLLIPMIIKAYSYFCTQYILADCPDVPATKALDRSKKMMQGNKGKVFVAQLSFIGWYLLIALIGVVIMAVAMAAAAGVDGVPFRYYSDFSFMVGGSVGAVVAWIVMALLSIVFLAPYVATTMAGFYDEIKKDAIERGAVSAEDFGPALLAEQPQVQSDVQPVEQPAEPQQAEAPAAQPDQPGTGEAPADGGQNTGANGEKKD